MYVQVLPILGCGDAIRTCFSKFCTFSGRARRSEYWFFMLVVNFITVFFATLFSLYATGVIVGYYYDYYYYYRREEYYNYNYNNNYKTDFSCKNDYDEKVYFNPLFFMGIFIFVIVEIILAIPLISASVRRLHDTGKSGAYLLLNFIPFGSLILLFLFIEDSQQAINEYGQRPPQQVQVLRPPQVPIQQNIYTELQEVNAPSNNNNQKPMATPMASS